MSKYYGLLGGAGFCLSYSLAGLMWGKKIHQFNRKQLVSLACMAWSMTSIFTGKINSFGVLVVMRVILGIA
jgi:predicted MFS family arabinose efflux permease